MTISLWRAFFSFVGGETVNCSLSNLILRMHCKGVVGKMGYKILAGHASMYVYGMPPLLQYRKWCFNWRVSFSGNSKCTSTLLISILFRHIAELELFTGQLAHDDRRSHHSAALLSRPNGYTYQARPGHSIHPSSFYFLKAFSCLLLLLLLFPEKSELNRVHEPL